MMQDQLTHRLQGLREEYAAGQQVMSELQGRQAQLQETLWRISGAIQVLEELLAAGKESPEAPAVAD